MCPTQCVSSVCPAALVVSTQAVVVQQDSFIEDQRQALSERSSSCTSLSRHSSRPSSLIEQEKHRSLEKQRQELASLQRQQAAHAEEKRRREKEWELREQQLTEREGLVRIQVAMHHFLWLLCFINRFLGSCNSKCFPCQYFKQWDGFLLLKMNFFCILPDKSQFSLAKHSEFSCRHGRLPSKAFLWLKNLKNSMSVF